MTECKYCQTPITWANLKGRSTPFNIDGTPHRCKGGKPLGQKDTLTGRLDSYTIGSATFTIKGGQQKTYALNTPMQKSFEKDRFLIPADNHPEIWLEFSKDDHGFILPGYRQAQRPEWGSDLNAPPAEQIPKPPLQKTTELPKETPGATHQADTQEDTWMQERDAFKTALIGTDREGINALLEYLEQETDFFIAPSSTKYHDACDGGLLHHSLKVYHNLTLLNGIFEGDYPEDSLIIIGLLHDLCKTNFYKTSFRNVKHDERAMGDQWIKEPYISIEDQFPLGHGEKSVILIQRHIKLTDLEIMGIRWHMMAYDDLAHSYAGNIAITGASTKYPLIVLVHMADLSASFLTVRIKEPTEGNNTTEQDSNREMEIGGEGK